MSNRVLRLRGVGRRREETRKTEPCLSKLSKLSNAVEALSRHCRAAVDDCRIRQQDSNCRTLSIAVDCCRSILDRRGVRPLSKAVECCRTVDAVELSSLSLAVDTVDSLSMLSTYCQTVGCYCAVDAVEPLSVLSNHNQNSNSTLSITTTPPPTPGNAAAVGATIANM